MPVTAVEQPYRLAEALKNVGVGHGDQFVASVPAVGISTRGNLLLCNVFEVDVHELTASGDFGRVPENVTLDPSLELPSKTGLYNLLNARFVVDGTIHISAIAGRTEFEPISAD